MIIINTDIPWLNELAPRVESFLAQDVLEVSIDGQDIRGYRSPDTKSIWIRDYSDMLRGVRYFEPDVRSVIQHFADTQAMNGRIFDYFTTCPEKLPCERENWTKYVRVPVEADVEYRFVKAAWLAWQADGDVEWIRQLLPHLERALNYLMTDPQRWHADFQLVKRPYTIDTWDFAYSEGVHDWLHFQIDKNTIWGIFHGDNSGLYEALNCLANICDSLGKRDKYEYYSLKARGIRKRINQLSWNGRYYEHFHKLTPIEIAGLDEDQQLSLSNPMAINRGVADVAQATALLREYQARADRTSVFAPWFSIDPPFPSGMFGDEKLVGGAYINGGIFPLAGGELALAALENGFEKYGIEQLRKYESLSSNGETYLWYFSDGEPSRVETSTSPDATPTDGWGSSAFLFALIRGVCGITDLFHSFNHIKFSPRWPALGSKSARLEISYAASGKSLSYSFVQTKTAMSYKLEGNFESILAHILLPEDYRASQVLCDGIPISFKLIEINDSLYADFKLSKAADPDIIVHLDLLS